MTEDKVLPFRQKDEIDDPLTEILRSGAKRLIEQAVEAEFAAFLASHVDLKLPDGRQRVVRHGHDPVRPIQTGIGPVEVEKPKARDRGALSTEERIRYSSSILPKWARRTKSLDVLLPALYLRGVSTGDFQEVLTALARQGRAQSFARRDGAAEGRVGGRISNAGKSAICRPGAMSTCGPTAFICRRGWRPQAECMLVLIGATPEGKKELLGFQAGLRESAQSWKELLVDLKARGLSIAPGIGGWRRRAGLLEGARRGISCRRAVSAAGSIRR